MRTLLVVGLLSVASAVPARATAACADWHAEARVVLEDAPRVAIHDGSLTGILFEYSVTSPGPTHTGTILRREDLASRTEVVDEAGRPVDVGPKTWPGDLIRDAPAHLSFSRGVRTTTETRPNWLGLPGGGIYRIRIGFSFPDFTVDRPKGSSTPRPTCETWSPWTTFELHPVVTNPFLGSGYGRAALRGAVLPHETTGYVDWVYADLEEMVFKTVRLGKTVEEFCKTLEGGPKTSARGTKGCFYSEIDARVDSAGVTHIIFPVAGGKTAYVRMGAKGAILESKELPGRKKLAGPTTAITLANKPSVGPAKPVPR